MKGLFILLGVVLVVGLLVGAFLIGRGLPGSQDQQPGAENTANEGSPADAEAQPGGKVIVLDNGSGPVRITFNEAPEMPDKPATVFGIFSRKQDNSIYVGTGNIEVSLEVVNDEVTVSASNDGPDVEIVVTGDTIIYEDITEIPVLTPEDAEKGELVVQRMVKPVDSVDAIDGQMEIRVWGERSGERVIADVLVYEVIGK